jgi:hypothetical protein
MNGPQELHGVRHIMDKAMASGQIIREEIECPREPFRVIECPRCGWEESHAEHQQCPLCCWPDPDPEATR